jgi:predicted enzyme related to lactoylglutathione lyase
MVTRETVWTAGTPCWVDLGVADFGRAQAFYGGLFGWDIEQGPPETGGYAMCMMDGRAAAGIGPKMGPPEAPSVWMTYISTDDADQTASRIIAAGGQLMGNPVDVTDVGRMAIAVDPAGAVFGIWQARAHIGVGIANEPGALTWNENMSRDPRGNKAFYRDVFGYDYDDMSSDYAALRVGTANVGGIGALGPDAPGTPASWTAYFAVHDTDEAVAKVAELGGSLLRPAWDTPFGRMAAVSDNQGAAFSVVEEVPAASD